MEETSTGAIVFIILTIIALGMGTMLALKLMYPAEMPVERDIAYYQQKQEVANAFHNLVKAYQDCSHETNCVCDIYQLKFPSKYSIKVENIAEDTRITLLDGSKQILSETVSNINTGILEKSKDKSCMLTGAAVFRPEKKEWYLQEGDYPDKHYLLNSIEELYKPSMNEACLITESMVLRENITKEGMEDYFGSMPRCTFKRKKKEELAIESFRKFVEEYEECHEKAAEEKCMCSFSRISLPEDYTINVEASANLTSFTLMKEKIGFEPEKEMLKMEARAVFMAEYPDMPSFHETSGCIKAKGDETAYYEKCMGNALQVKSAVFFGENAGMMRAESGMIRTGDERVNRKDISICMVQSTNAYELLWPAEKLNNVYYASECFGSTEAECSKGIGIPQQGGSKVFAADDGSVEYIGSGIIRLRHRKGLRTQYENVIPLEDINERMQVTRGQQIGKLMPEKQMLYFSLTDSRFDSKMLEADKICMEKENKNPAISVFSYGLYYLNPACYFSRAVRDSIVYPNKCTSFFKGCTAYGNGEEPKYDVRLKVLAIPVNWERKLPYLLYANDALEKFSAASPLNECPQRFRKVFADGITDYGDKWESGSCHVESRNSCLVNALEAVKSCAEQYKERTGEDYDYALGIEDSNIANYPECNFADRGWTSSNSDAMIVESANAADTLHELGHKFGLKDQYCDCSLAGNNDVCGFNAMPNPLRKELGCGEKCCVAGGETPPYMEGCRWCSGNIDMAGRDANEDKMLDSGRRTAMSNFIDSEKYSIDEYLLMKASVKLQCA